ncbi:hypothetical protein SPHINGO391_10023 [Sphingomonas aurantiaca]|uniref:Uncharacterized protein n=1 Tax=Sphingomonas aurantiaca TaxID=185949 RepID=A0A5E7XNC9_9SPHN|nr:hypothetical protein SPHINGO391_10023 [Sphingomonas aurantiaca]
MGLLNNGSAARTQNCTFAASLPTVRFSATAFRSVACVADCTLSTTKNRSLPVSYTI